MPGAGGTGFKDACLVVSSNAVDADVDDSDKEVYVSPCSLPSDITVTSRMEPNAFVSNAMLSCPPLLIGDWGCVNN